MRTTNLRFSEISTFEQQLRDYLTTGLEKDNAFRHRYNLLIFISFMQSMGVK